MWVGNTYGLANGKGIPIITLPITILAGVLMVSNIRYHSFKQFDFRNKVPFVSILIVVLIFVFIASEPSLVLFVIAVSYALSGPILTLIQLRRRHLIRMRRARRMKKEKSEIGGQDTVEKPQE